MFDEDELNRCLGLYERMDDDIPEVFELNRQLNRRIRRINRKGLCYGELFSYFDSVILRNWVVGPP